MSNHQDRIDQLNRKLEILLGKQELLKSEQDILQSKQEILQGRQKNFAINLMEIYQEIEAVKQMRPEDLVIPDDSYQETVDSSAESEEATTQTDTTQPVQDENTEVPIAAFSETSDFEVIAEKASPEQAEPKAPHGENTSSVPGQTERPIANERTNAPEQDIPTGTTPLIDGQAAHQSPPTKSSLEKFIGENLISKLGIAITVNGVAIFAKYSIENNLISPLTRIIIGYLAGLGLIGFGMKLKAKYENFSAVLISGALATLYFITFAAYSFYGLFPQLVAFGLMLMITVFGVVAALNYNKQVIAHIGLVGAYAVPFLLSSGSGDVVTLFTYTAIINVGILVISLKKYWKPLFYSAFVLTWLIFISWNSLSYEPGEHFGTALFYASLFFVIFYVTFLAYKLAKSEQFQKSDIVLVLLNSFIYYALGYGILNHHDEGEHFLGLFTVGNAIAHFAVATLLHRKKLADRNLFYLISGLVMVFITIAVPVQLDGNWVTLLWTLQAVLLFWVGRTKGIPFYEKLSYPLMLLGFLSLMQDWSEGYDSYFVDANTLTPILNSYFLTSVLFIAAFSGIYWINATRPASKEFKNRGILQLISYLIPAILIGTTYAAFFLEIEQYGQQRYYASEISETMEYGGVELHNNHALLDFNRVWLFVYTLLFLSALGLVNIKKIKNRVLGIVTLVAGLITTLLFLGGGLFMLSELRESYINRGTNEFYDITFFYVGIRYVAFAALALMLFALRKLTLQKFMNIQFNVPAEIIMHICSLWILSSELLNWMDIAGSSQTYKLGLSILWGVYALLLIALGIKKSKAYLRIGGMILFAITLLKLFFYDIAALDTISKTVVFISLGILMLIVSFLYNKYKARISGNPKPM
ncbi:MAG: DUF2339 domain-containing protein [Pricia sp.]